MIYPMAQYSADDVQMTDWHLMHLGQLACPGAALLTIESTAVAADGRGTHGDVGLYSDQYELAIARVLSSNRQWFDMPIGIQLTHAGRKASQKAWKGAAQIPPGQPNSCTIHGPSPLAFAGGDTPPIALH